jgi:hypothetical protein
MSYMFQGDALFDSMTVYENVAIPIRETMNLSKPEIDRRVMARIEQVELGEEALKYPSQILPGIFKSRESVRFRPAPIRAPFQWKTLNSRSVPDLPRVIKAKPLSNWNPL